MTSGETPTLNDVCLFIEDCLHATAPTQDDGYPLIRTPNIGKGRLILDGVYRISEETYQKWTRRAKPEKDDLILAREAPAGNIAVVQDEQIVALGQRTVHLRPDQNQVDSTYLCYFLLTPKMQGSLLAGETGATAKHINLKDIRRLPLPGLHERAQQSGIAQAISAYDDLIENNRRRIKLLEEAARLIYREWFVHLRFPRHQREHVADGVPSGWTQANLPEVIEFNPKEALPKENIVFVPMSALSESGMTVDEEILEVRDKGTTVKFKNNDTLLARITPCLENGKTAYVGFLDEDVVASGSTEYIVMRGKSVGPCFVYCLARSDNFRGHAIASMIGSSGRQRVQLGALAEYTVLVPDKEIADEFESIAQPMFDQIWKLAKMNSRLQRARDLLLPRLMSGEIEV